LNSHLFEVSSTVKIYLILIILIVAIGTVATYELGKTGGFNVQDIGPLTALYFTIVTVSTLGYGDIYPVTDTAKIFVILLVLVGIGTFVSAVTVISGEILSKRVISLSGRINLVERRTLKNHIVLIGMDTVNNSIARALHKIDRNKFIIVTSDKVAADRIGEAGYHVYVADATSESDMEKFELGRARAVFIDVKDSSRTIYALLIARNLSKLDNITVIAQTEDVERHLKDLGIIKPERIINPNRRIAEELAEKLSNG